MGYAQMKIILSSSAILLALLFHGRLQSQVLWNNSSGGSYSSGSNWVGGLVPMSTQDALIDLAGNYTITLTASESVRSLTMDNLQTTLNHTAGNYNITNHFLNSNGTYEYYGGTLNIGAGMTMTDGVMKIDNGSILNLTGTMALNGGPANGGYILMYSGGINGGTLTAMNTGRIDVFSGRFSNTYISAGVLDLHRNGNDLFLTNNTIIQPGSTLSTAGSVIIGVGQSSVQSFNLRFEGAVQSLYGEVNNATFTIGPSGNSSPTVLYNAVSNSAGNALFIGGGGVGVNRSILNTGVIENSTHSVIHISPSGDFTNAGVLRAAGTGKIIIAPAGTFYITPSSIFQTSGSGQIEINTTNVVNQTNIIFSNIINSSTNTQTGIFNNATSGSVTVQDTGVLNVGNDNNSSIINSGNINVQTTGSGTGTINVGSNSSRGTLTNLNGTVTLNGVANSRVLINGGTLTGAGTINALSSAGNAASVVIGSSGRLSPGNSPGQITIGGGLDVGGQLELDISSGGGNNNSNTNGNTTPGSGFDTIQVRPPANEPLNTTTATIRTAATSYRLKTANSSQSQFNNDAFWNTAQSWTILRTTLGGTNGSGIILLDENNNSLTGTVDVTSKVELFDTSERAILFLSEFPYGNFTLSINGGTAGFDGGLQLNWQPVPEPMTILGASFGLLVSIAAVRKKTGEKKTTVTA